MKITMLSCFYWFVDNMLQVCQGKVVRSAQVRFLLTKLRFFGRIMKGKGENNHVSAVYGFLKGRLSHSKRPSIAR